VLVRVTTERFVIIFGATGGDCAGLAAATFVVVVVVEVRVSLTSEAAFVSPGEKTRTVMKCGFFFAQVSA
jgi:hypothetical protein